jgi:hypothetical protein
MKLLKLVLCREIQAGRILPLAINGGTLAVLYCDFKSIQKKLKMALHKRNESDIRGSNCFLLPGLGRRNFKEKDQTNQGNN